MTKKTAIVLFNLGGPIDEKSIEPFLFNLFNDKAIISLPNPFRFLLAKLISKKRAKTAQQIYAEIGGKSPILQNTIAQSDEISKELSLDENFADNFKIFIAMRYYHPRAKEVVEKIKAQNFDEIILLPLYPQFSTTTSESSIKEFVEILQKAGISIKNPENFPSLSKILLKNPKNSQQNVDLKILCCYFDEDDFVLSHARLLERKIFDNYLDPSKIRILFSAHGLPQKIVDGGDPYVFQVEQSANLVFAKLKEILSKKGQKDEEG